MRLKFTALAALAAIMALTVTALASGGGMPNMPGMSHSHAQTASASAKVDATIRQPTPKHRKSRRNVAGHKR